MAKTEKIRFHLILPEEEDNEQEDEETGPVGVCPDCGGGLVAETHLSLGEAVCVDCRLVSEVEIDDEAVSRSEYLTSKFRDRFRLAYEQFSGYVGQLEGETILSTEIIEDRRDHREDIDVIYECAAEKFPDGDVLLTEQNSPRNRNDEDFLAYTSDVIIRVCNTHPTAPKITRQVELTNPKVRGSNYPFRDGNYIIQTEDTEIIALDLNEVDKSWRRDTGHDTLSKGFSFEEGIVQTTRKPPNTLFLVAWEDGAIKWEIEDVTTGEEEYIRTWEPVVSNQAIYGGSGEGTIYRVDVVTADIEEITTLDGEIRGIKFEDNSLFVTTAIEAEKDESSNDGWGGGRKSYDFSLASLSNGEISWKTEFEEGGRGSPVPYLTTDTVVTESNDKLKAYDRKEGNQLWSLSKENFESELGMDESEESEDSEWRSFSSRSFELKILDSIGETIYCVARLGDGFLAAIDGRTGDIEWVNQEYNTIPYNLGVIHEHDGKLVFNHQDNDFVTSFIALDLESGKEEWQFATPGWTGGDRSIGFEFVFITSQECIVFND